jgi:hypothetical protein
VHYDFIAATDRQQEENHFRLCNRTLYNKVWNTQETDFFAFNIMERVWINDLPSAGI